MIAKTQAKLNRIVDNYRNGNKSDAAKSILSLTRVELFELLINDHQLENGFVGDRDGRYNFQNFVDHSLNHWH